MRRVKPTILTLITLVSILAPGLLFAESVIRQQLTNSMSYYEVLKAWGPPKEKHEHESKREDIWMYDDSKVIFNNGKVVAWMRLDRQPLITEASSNREARTIEGFGDTLDNADDASSGNEEQVEQILRDIMEEPSQTVPMGGNS